MNKIDPKQAKIFVIVFSVIALLINSTQGFVRHQRFSSVSAATDVIQVATAQKAAEVVGAAKTELNTNDTVKQFSSQPTKASDSTSQDEIPNPTQQIGNLCVVLESLTRLNDGTFSLGLTLQNKSLTNSIAVAMYHDVCFSQPCALLTSMTASDGTQFMCDDSGLTGIRSTRFSPVPLTEIEPNGESKVSIRFWMRGNLSRTATSISFQSEIVVNQNYDAHAYDNYRLDQNVLPPNCKIKNFVLEIPIPKS